MPTADAPPASEHLGAQLRKERIRASLFRKPPPLIKIERFTLLERVGAGSMSEVFAAYDERLDRRVAIKLVRGDNHRDSDADSRLLREAQTLARLSHPNVVQVYDAGHYQGRVFIAMEFIRGQTLSEWLDELRDLPMRRRQQEIVRCFSNAGRGLEAAHQAGLTHRDIKPNNVVVGDDGRVRVVDFGLARSSGDDEPVDDAAGAVESTAESAAESTGTSALSSERISTGELSSSPQLTPAGAVLGTPAYMAPELFRGTQADSRSDQFSFCVTLYEALHGERPYPRTSAEAVAKGFSSADVQARSRARDIPGPIREALARGLSVEPESRYPDMGKLLYALKERPSRRFFPWVALALALAVALGAWALNRGADDQRCLGAERELADVWSPERRAALERAVMATGREYANEAWPRLERDLQRYAASWQTMHRDACMAHREGRQSGQLLDKRMLCLQRRRAALASTIDVIEDLESTQLEQVLRAVKSLPAIDYCGNVEALSAEVPPPADPTTAEQVKQLNQQLIRGKALEGAARWSEARTEVGEVVERARSLRYDPLLADALLTLGRAIVSTDDRNLRQDAIEPLQKAVQVGLRAHMDSLAVEAFARLVFARGTTKEASEAVVAFAPTIEALGERLVDHRFAYALLLNNIGTAHLALKDKERALSYFEQAVAESETLTAAVSASDGSSDLDTPTETVETAETLELLAATLNLAMLTADDGRRQALIGEVLTRLEAGLGPSHPRTLLRRILAASFIGDAQRAHDTLAPACRADPRSFADNPDALIRCLYKLALLAAELGQRTAGAEHLSRLVAFADELRARARKASSPAPEQADVLVELAQGYLHLYRDRAALAVPRFRQALAGLPSAPEHWWMEKDIAETHLGLGESLLRTGEHASARISLERAVAIYSRLIERSYNTDYRRRLARARTLLAELPTRREAAKAAEGGAMSATR